MCVTCCSPSTRTSPRVMVVLPAAESPTTPRMMGRGMLTSSTLLGLAQHRAAQDVGRLDGDEVPPRDRRPAGEEAIGLAQAGAVDGVADAACVGEPRQRHP